MARPGISGGDKLASLSAFDSNAFDGGSFFLHSSSVDPAFDAASFDKVNAFDEHAFSFGGEPVPTVDEATQAIVGGGNASHGTLRGRRREGRSKEEIRQDRERFGIREEVAEVIASVAARQAETLVQDDTKRFEELLREITLRGLEYEARYLEALSQERQRLIDAEIGRLINRKIDDEGVILMLLAVGATL